MQPTAARGVSIIVCSFNGVRRLQPTLAHLVGQKLPPGLPWEIVFVDNRSTDGTYEFVESFFRQAGSAVQVQLVREARPGKAYALETGYDSALYEYLITCDDDNWLSEDYVHRAVELMDQHPDAGLIGGEVTGAFEVPPPGWFSRLSEGFVVGRQAQHDGYFEDRKSYVWGAGMVFRKSIWTYLRACGFEFVTGKAVNKAVGEDSELSFVVRFLGYRFYYAAALHLQHWMPRQRINWENCVRLYTGFGATQPYLGYYRVLFKQGRLSDFQIWIFWMQLLAQYAYRWLRIAAATRGQVFWNPGALEGEWLRLKFEERRSSIRELFSPGLFKKVALIRIFTRNVKLQLAK